MTLDPTLRDCESIQYNSPPYQGGRLKAQYFHSLSAWERIWERFAFRDAGRQSMHYNAERWNEVVWFYPALNIESNNISVACFACKFKYQHF